MKIERQSVIEKGSGTKFHFVKMTDEELKESFADWRMCHCGEPMEYRNAGKNPLCKKHTDMKLKGKA